ncbi:MAG: GNAT family N-acetyltransferase [Acidimicrobiales bacterium]
MRRIDTITGHADRIRIGPWRGDPSVALLSPTPGSALTAGGLDQAVASISRQGYQSVLTPALTPPEQLVFLQFGFHIHERLHLLRHDLRVLPQSTTPNITIRRGRTRDIGQVLELDGLAFDPFWRFDLNGLIDARHATPRSRFRVAVCEGRIVGYYITGFARRLGYLQRLAVHPQFYSRGIGTALVGDALRWCRHRGCDSVLVNTQEINQRALSLYRHLRFSDEPTGLAVLAVTLPQRDLP